LTAGLDRIPTVFHAFRSIRRISARREVGIPLAFSGGAIRHFDVRSFMKALLSLLACVSVTTSLLAQLGPSPTIAARAQGAGRVVVARVLDVQSRFATNQFGDQLIVSDLVLEVTETFKGPAAATINVTVEGGTVGDLTLKVSDLPSFSPGDRGMFFLDPGPGGRLVPHNRGRGLLKVSPSGVIEGSSVTLDAARKEVASALGKGL
jgi:hypothetical protein